MAAPKSGQTDLSKTTNAVNGISLSPGNAPKPAVSTATTLKRVLVINDSLRLHLYGTQLIVEAGLMLIVPQITIAKAQMLFHHFYYKQDRDLADFPPFHIAMTCTYLASKLDEHTRRHRDILTVFDRIHKKRNSTPKSHLQTIDPHGKRYIIWKENLFNFELRVLASMGFTCSMESAHKYLLQMLVELLSTEALAKHSWALLNDLHRVPQVMEYSTLEVAASSVFLAARRLQIKLPDDPSWCDLFGVEKERLMSLASLTLEILELPEEAFQLDAIKGIDLDCNPQSVRKQMDIQKKRAKEKQQRLKAKQMEKHDSKESNVLEGSKSKSPSALVPYVDSGTSSTNVNNGNNSNSNHEHEAGNKSNNDSEPATSSKDNNERDQNVPRDKRRKREHSKRHKSDRRDKPRSSRKDKDRRYDSPDRKRKRSSGYSSRTSRREYESSDSDYRNSRRRDQRDRKRYDRENRHGDRSRSRRDRDRSSSRSRRRNRSPRVDRVRSKSPQRSKEDKGDAFKIIETLNKKQREESPEKDMATKPGTAGTPSDKKDSVSG